MPSSRQQQPAAKNANEGEGSRTAAHRYEQGVKRTMQAGHVEEKAREAARALDSPKVPCCAVPRQRPRATHHPRAGSPKASARSTEKRFTPMLSRIR